MSFGGHDELLAVLGLPRSATIEDVRTRRKALARRWHPDVVGGDEARMKAILHAAAALERLLPEGRSSGARVVATGPVPARSRAARWGRVSFGRGLGIGRRHL